MAPRTTSERRPLLQPIDDDEAPAASASASASAPQQRGQLAPSQRVTIAVLCILVIALLDIGAGLVTVPLSQLQEGIICRDIYPDVGDSSRDPRCKNEDVQSELSMLQGWDVTFSLIPGLLTSVLYGLAADKYGRRAVLCLSLLGIALAQSLYLIICAFPHIFPIRLTWAAALSTFLGGGEFVCIAMIYTIASDMSTKEQLSTTFFYLTAVSISGGLVSSLLAYAAMTRGPWFSALLGVGCLGIGVLVAFSLPETRGLKDSSGTSEDVDNDAHDSEDQEASKGNKLWALFVSTQRQASEMFQSLFWRNKKLGLLLFSLVFTTLGRYVVMIIRQYATKRFGWSWSEAGLLSSITSFMNLVLAVAVLPLINQVMLIKFKISPLTKDVWIARTTILAMLVGTIGIGLSTSSVMLIASLVTHAFSFGYGPSVRSVLVLVAGQEHIGSLFSAISVVEIVGSLIAGPSMAAAFRIGLRWGGAWLGLPFFGASGLLMGAVVIMFGVRLEDPEKLKEDTLSDDDD